MVSTTVLGEGWMPVRLTLISTAWLDGSARAFQADLYEGTDDTGSLVGTIAVELDPLLALQLDSLGLSNVTGDHDRQMHLSLHAMSYVPEPITLGMLGLGGLGLLRRRRARGA